VCLGEEITAANTQELHLKGQAQNGAFFQTLKKVTTLTCYIKISVGYFVLKLHTHTRTHTLGT